MKFKKRKVQKSPPAPERAQSAKRCESSLQRRHAFGTRVCTRENQLAPQCLCSSPLHVLFNLGTVRTGTSTLSSRAAARLLTHSATSRARRMRADLAVVRKVTSPHPKLSFMVFLIVKGHVPCSKKGTEKYKRKPYPKFQRWLGNSHTPSNRVCAPLPWGPSTVLRMFSFPPRNGEEMQSLTTPWWWVDFGARPRRDNSLLYHFNSFLNLAKFRPVCLKFLQNKLRITAYASWHEW